MAGKRRRFTPEFKARVAFEALRKRESVQVIASRHEVHRTQVSRWKRQLIEGLLEVLSGDAGRRVAEEREAEIRDLETRLERLTDERDFLQRVLESTEPDAD